MQTILKVVCDNRGRAQMVDDFILQFCEKAAGDPPTADLSSPKADDVALAIDDCMEGADSGAKRPILGSFGRAQSQIDENTKFVFVNPLILSYRPNHHRLCVWIGGPLDAATGELESD